MEAVESKIPVSIPTVENEMYWRNHSQVQAASGLSKRTYCQMHEVNYYRFVYWARKLASTASTCVAVKLKPEVSTSTKVTLCTLVLAAICM